MINTASVALRRLQTAIAYAGKTYKFNRFGKNEFGEEAFTEPPIEILVEGIYHNGSAGYITLETLDAAKVVSKTTPQILTLWEYASKISMDDRIQEAGKLYKVTGVQNIHNMNIIGGISMEVVL